MLLSGDPLSFSSDNSSDEAAPRGLKMRDLTLYELQGPEKYNTKLAGLKNKSSHTV